MDIFIVFIYAYLLIGVVSILLDFRIKKINIVKAPLYTKSKEHLYSGIIMGIILWPFFRIWLIILLILIIVLLLVN